MIQNLVLLQNELKAPKSRYNSFGKFNYRSLEDIMTAVKPLLAKYELQLTISDDVVAVGNRVYIRAAATLKDAEGNTETVTAMARESEEKKGMDGSQLTGTASSYARKYCLNGLFCIDDTADADTDAYYSQTNREDVMDRAYLEQHGGERISRQQIARLTNACRASGKTLEQALKACCRDDVTEISVVQYVALMSQMGQAA